MKTKKVCILTSVHKPYDIRIFHKQAKSLAKHYDVTLIAQHTKQETQDNVTIIPLPSPKSRFQRMIGLSCKLYKEAKKQRADIYHFHDPELLPVGALLRLTTKKPIIYDVHEDYPQVVKDRHWIPKIIRTPLTALVWLYEQFFALFATKIVTVTDTIAAKFPRHKTRQIRNYPDLPPSKNTKSNPATNPPTLIYTGGIRRSRGAEVMVQALALINQVSPARLLLLGPFQEPDLQEYLGTLPGSKFTDYLGIVPHQVVWEYLAKATVGIVCLEPRTTFETSLPIKLFEYMAAELPVIASDFPFWRQFVQDNDCGFMVDPRDPQAIAQAAITLLTNPETTRRMGESGRQAALTKYTWKTEEKKLISLYRTLLKEEPKDA